MKKDVVISVIVPIYNVKDYLEKCIESIISQSYQNIQIILVDDGSTDGCAEICDSYRREDNRIHVIHKKNGGPASARKMGGSVSVGEYIVCVDGDDWIEKDRILNIVKEGINNKPDMIYLSGHYREYGSKSYLPQTLDIKGVFREEEIRQKFIENIVEEKSYFRKNITMGLWSFCIKKDIYVKGQEYVSDKVCFGEDVIWLIGCLLESRSLVCMREQGYHYVRRENSITNNFFIKENHKAADIFYYYAKKNFFPNNTDKAIRRIIVQYTFALLIDTDYERLLSKESCFLFPFTQVKNGSKIIIYGAGAIGRKVAHAIRGNDNFKVVAWVDKYKQGIKIDDYEILSPMSIYELEYDYIIMSITDASTAEEAGKDLAGLGIPESKIAYMNPAVITEEFLPMDVETLY